MEGSSDVPRVTQPGHSGAGNMVLVSPPSSAVSWRLKICWKKYPGSEGIPCLHRSPTSPIADDGSA